jgi:hypothetical protein
MNNEKRLVVYTPLYQSCEPFVQGNFNLLTVKEIQELEKLKGTNIKGVWVIGVERDNQKCN